MSGFQSLARIFFWTLCAAAGSAQEETAPDWNWHWTQGQSAMSAGRHAVAGEHFRQVAALLPSEPSSRILLARCESLSGHHNAAVAALSEAVTLGWEDTDSLQQEADLAAIQKE